MIKIANGIYILKSAAIMQGVTRIGRSGDDLVRSLVDLYRSGKATPTHKNILLNIRKAQKKGIPINDFTSGFTNRMPVGV